MYAAPDDENGFGLHFGAPTVMIRPCADIRRDGRRASRALSALHEESFAAQEIAIIGQETDDFNMTPLGVRLGPQDMYPPVTLRSPNSPDGYSYPEYQDQEGNIYSQMVPLNRGTNHEVSEAQMQRIALNRSSSGRNSKDFSMYATGFGINYQSLNPSPQYTRMPLHRNNMPEMRMSSLERRQSSGRTITPPVVPCEPIYAVRIAPQGQTEPIYAQRMAQQGPPEPNQLQIIASHGPADSVYTTKIGPPEPMYAQRIGPHGTLVSGFRISQQNLQNIPSSTNSVDNNPEQSDMLKAASVQNLNTRLSSASQNSQVTVVDQGPRETQNEQRNTVSPSSVDNQRNIADAQSSRIQTNSIGDGPKESDASSVVRFALNSKYCVSNVISVLISTKKYSDYFTLVYFADSSYFFLN